jgi:protein-S-isoprenylcysteine O-methyltransferase Ste14
MRNRPAALAGTALFLIAAPGTVAGFVPWWMTGWRAEAPFFGTNAFPILGLLLVALGAAGLLDSFARFAWQGLGTPAPIAPTRHLVISGLYRFVRNPMYVAVTALIFGQALLFGRTSLLVYGAVVWLAFHLFVLAYEEPTLRQTYGDEYEAYRRRVPRWIPRLTPWPGREH